MDAFQLMTIAFGCQSLGLAGMSIANHANLMLLREARKEIEALKQQLKEAHAIRRP
jgi:hypothetical protein